VTSSEFIAVVAAIAKEADGIVSLHLEPTVGDKMPAWEPGAHIDLVLGSHLERQYSLCGDPTDLSHWRLGVLREPESRGGSAYVHETLAVGDQVVCRGPRNNFSLADAGKYLFVAGGVGITPILPMAFREELAGYGERVVLWPQDTHGRLDLAAILGTPAADTAVYCCGPGTLLDAVEQHCASWPTGSPHLERFRPKNGALEGANLPFEVELEASGITLTVGADQTLAEAIEAAGVDLPTSCREGTCGTCETYVLEGEPDHRDSYLTAEEQASGEVIMPCCSRSRSPRLVLDL
jgi:ferredoxin-NADP reductase